MRNFCKTLFVILFFASCKKDTLITDDAPTIEFVSITPGSVVEYQDSITITISYKDANGDLGENDASVKNLFITDSRNNVTYQYRIKQLSPDNSDISIQGNLNVVLANTAIIDAADSTETFHYSIYVRDRADNDSNTVTTSNIEVEK